MQAQAGLPIGWGGRLIGDGAERQTPLASLSNTRRIGGGPRSEFSQPHAGRWPLAGVRHANSFYCADRVLLRAAVNSASAAWIN